MIERSRGYGLARQAGVVAACSVLLALTTAQPHASAAGIADAPVAIEQARATFKARNYRDAIALLDPKSRRGLWARGRLEIVNKQYPRAIGDLTAYIAQDEKHSDTAYYFRGLTYNRIESYRLALTDLQTYVGRAPTDPDGYKERAVARYGLGDKDGALADLGEAQNGYRKGGQTADVDLIGTWIAAVRAGTPISPP